MPKIANKTLTIYACSHCDAQYPKWQGQCLECGKWGTIQQTSISKTEDQQTQAKAAETMLLEGVTAKDVARIVTGINEFDRVLGGGIVPGSLILLGGDPGIGKSTLLMQVALRTGGKTLYVSAEETAQQVKLRLDRLSQNAPNVRFLAEEAVETITQTIIKEKPICTIIDSIQTVASAQVSGEVGSVNQIRASTTKFLEVAKQNNIPIILVGHVTKEGVLGGPKTLEHLVDVVVYFEGDQNHAFRLLRTVKNRFGSTAEVGVFEMQENGLSEVKNPSQLFLSERFVQTPGSVITSIVEGSRAFLIEVQALVTKTVFGYPQRKCSGFDVTRAQLLIAVLQERAKLKLGMYDVHINIVGGLKIKEPSADLAVCLAIASAYKNKPHERQTIVIGEVGLGGEIRSAAKLQERLAEAERLGFKKAMIPASTNIIKKTRLELVKINNLKEALEKI